jgi:hypothetical protein
MRPTAQRVESGLRAPKDNTCRLVTGKASSTRRAPTVQSVPWNTLKRAIAQATAQHKYVKCAKLVSEECIYLAVARLRIYSLSVRSARGAGKDNTSKKSATELGHRACRRAETVTNAKLESTSPDAMGRVQTGPVAHVWHVTGVPLALRVPRAARALALRARCSAATAAIRVQQESDGTHKTELHHVHVSSVRVVHSGKS